MPTVPVHIPMPSSRVPPSPGSFLSAFAQVRRLTSLGLKHLHNANEAQLLQGLAALTQLTRLEVKDVQVCGGVVVMVVVGCVVVVGGGSSLECSAHPNRLHSALSSGHGCARAGV